MSNVYVGLQKTNSLKMSSVCSITSGTMFKRIITLNRLVIAKFSAEWCPPSVGIAPHYEQIARNNPSIVFILVENGRTRGAPIYRKLNSKYGVRYYPTFIFFVNGEPLPKRLDR
eukprot:UN13460